MAGGIPLFTGRILEALAGKHDERLDAFVPHLQRLILRGKMETNDATVVALVRSRPRLVELVLQFTESEGFARPSPLSEAAQATLSELLAPRRCVETT